MIKSSVFTIFTLLLLFSCQQTEKEKVIGTWTRLKKMKDGVQGRIESKDSMQIQFKDDGEMLYLTNGERSGIGFYYYKIVADSIRVTNVEIDDAGKRDSTFIFSNRFTIRHDTMITGTDKEKFYFKKASD